jgi:hypothetical protein
MRLDHYLVEEGDCLHFNSTVPHKVVAADENQEVKILSVRRFKLVL